MILTLSAVVVNLLAPTATTNVARVRCNVELSRWQVVATAVAVVDVLAKDVRVLWNLEVRKESSPSTSTKPRLNTKLNYLNQRFHKRSQCQFGQQNVVNTK